VSRKTVTNKRNSEYWDNLSRKQPNSQGGVFDVKTGQMQAGWEPEIIGDPFYSSDIEESTAANRHPKSTSVASRTETRNNKIHKNAKTNRFKNINDGLLPYELSADCVSIKDTILLCQKAYANIPIFRNAVDIMSELSNSPIYLEGGDKKSKFFIDKWLEKIKVWSLSDQFFREYFKSGNIFHYRLDAKLTEAQLKNMVKGFGGSFNLGAKVPIRYVLLNPYDMAMNHTTSFSNGHYKKLLSKFEIEVLRNPQTEEDKQIFNALTPEAKQEIKQGQSSATGIYMDLDPKHLVTSFYKKQDYEPFAIPFGFPVLDDINWKLELKKIDQAISRTIQNVILLVTIGNEPDKGGVDASNISALQQIFKNESVGRVLVSDYTTEAEFIIPDLEKVIGPKKYEIVNADIREGLQNIIVGNEKFANTQIKAKIFLERLKEASNAFLNEFLQPQIDYVCRQMGFRNTPTARCQGIDLADKNELHRAITRMIELGILPPEQGIEAMKTGVLPEPKELEEAQKKFVEQRKLGYYNPMVGGIPMLAAPEGEGDDNPTQQKPKKEHGRPKGESSDAVDFYSREDLQEVIYLVQDFKERAIKAAKAALDIKRISKEKKQIIDELVENIIVAGEKEKWDKILEECLADQSRLAGLDALPEIREVAAEHNLEDYPAALLYHSKE
jgi:hypothetical protein